MYSISEVISIYKSVCRITTPDRSLSEDLCLFNTYSGKHVVPHRYRWQAEDELVVRQRWRVDGQWVDERVIARDDDIKLCSQSRLAVFTCCTRPLAVSRCVNLQSIKINVDVIENQQRRRKNASRSSRSANSSMKASVICSGPGRSTKITIKLIPVRGTAVNVVAAVFKLIIAGQRTMSDNGNDIFGVTLQSHLIVPVSAPLVESSWTNWLQVSRPGVQVPVWD